MKSIYKRITAMLLVLLLCVSMVPTSAFADGFETENIDGGSVRKLNTGLIQTMSIGEQGKLRVLFNTLPESGSIQTQTMGQLSGTPAHSIILADGKTQAAAYCLNHERGATDMNGYTWEEMGSDSRSDVIGTIMVHGFQYSGQPSGNPPTPWGVGDSNDRWLVTQLLVWATCNGHIFMQGNHLIGIEAAVDADMQKIAPYAYNQANFLSYYNQLKEKITKSRLIPSFASYPAENGLAASAAKTITLKWDGEKFAATVTDTNGVLSNYNFRTAVPGVTITSSGNSMTLTTDQPISSPVTSSTVTYRAQGGRGAVAVWRTNNHDSSQQDFATYTAGYDPVAAIITVQTEGEITGNAGLIKTSEDGKVSGLTFIISGSDGNTYTKTTNANGRIDISDLPIYTPDMEVITYTVTEQTPTRYVPVSSKSFTLDNGDVTVRFENKLKRGDLTVTKSAEDGLHQGMKFHLYGTSLSGIAVDEYAVVGSDGKARFQNVLIGSGYTLEEVGTPDRYVTPAKQTVNIEWNKVTSKSFENKLKRGDLTVTKTAEDGLEQGLRFHLYGTSYSGLPVDEYATVGSDGKAYFKNILIGTGFTLEEVETPVRYVIPEKQTAVVEWNKVTEKSFDNRLKKWNLTVTKRDSENGTAQGDASLAGAVYGIYKGEEQIDRYTTDAKGQFTTKYYICGDDWSLREITPSEGYLLDETVHRIGAEAKNYAVEYNAISDTVYETIKKGNIAIIKHTDDGSTQLETPEVGAEFSVYLKSSGSYDATKITERDYLVCDENGFAETKMLPYGIYTVHQVKGWDGRELLPDFDVYISKDGHTYRYLANNANFKSYVKIIKVDSETGKSIPYAGAGFQLYRPDGSLISQSFTYPTPTTIDTFYTNDEGYLFTPESLEYGTGYSLVEVSAPYGYVLNTDPVFFDVTADNATEESAVTVVKVVKENMPQKGIIKISKTGEVFASVVESEVVYQPVYSVQGLPGAIYEIIAAEDIYTLDGTLRYAKGTVADTITTDETGNAQSKPLYLGKFEVKEITAPFGMVLNEEIRAVELTYAGQEIEITETAASFYNERQKAAVSLDKVMEQNDKFGIGQKSEITAVAFGLYAAEDLTAADGTVIPADSLLEIVSVDENGHAVFATDLPFGSYYLKEIATDSHYVLSDAKYPVQFEYAGQEVVTVNLAGNDGETIQNDLIYGTIKGLKIDREAEEHVAGAVFGLFRGDEIEFSEETAILTATSGEDGAFVFESVPYGNWVIVELAPAEGFLPNNEIHHVYVTVDEEIIEITVVNDRIPEISTTATVDGEKKIHPSKTVTIDDVVEYKHLIPGKEYTVKGILMNKATGKPFLANGEQVTSEVTFVPENPSGKVIVPFVFDGTRISRNAEIVVFEGLYKDGIELAVHADIKDIGQTVTVLVPEVGTTATVDGEKEVNATEVFTLEDVVSYNNLIPGKEYTVNGILMDKATGKPLLLNGEEIRSEASFVPGNPSGEVVVSFTFDAKYIKTDTDIVVFESLYHEGRKLAAHADIEDESQTVTVHVPEICTQATVNGKKEVKATGKITIEDVISYKNLTPGKEYTMKGVLMDKATGQPFLVNGKQLHSKATFTPETGDGEVTVFFIFDADGITAETEIVVFESLYRDSVEIAVHADIEDAGQTVKLIPPLPETPKTGDDSHTALWRVLAVIAFLGFAACGGWITYIVKKRKKEEVK
ncbi:MAG: VaFE repeat-containing surface-anchored protein [Acutalibacter sp.]|nr:VaFE repeat-containing surface-anchored protein [Acutalibacter sp.]